MPEAAAYLVGKSLGSEIVLFGSLDNLVAMLVCSGQKQGLFALDLVESCRRIGQDGGIGMPQMGIGIDIVNGSGDIERAHEILHSRPCLALVVIHRRKYCASRLRSRHRNNCRIHFRHRKMTGQYCQEAWD